SAEREGGYACGMTLVLMTVLAAMLVPGQEGAKPEATSLLGRPLFAPQQPAETRAALEKNLAAAKAEFDRNPGSVDAAIWLGRRTAYLGRYRDAIAVFSTAIEKHPADPRLYRH